MSVEMRTCPVCGDTDYGDGPFWPKVRCWLKSLRLAFSWREHQRHLRGECSTCPTTAETVANGGPTS